LVYNCVVYEIPCGGCDHKYYGESSRGLVTRLKEHKADIRRHRVSSALVNHVDDKGHLPKWDQAKVPKSDLTKQQRKAIEAFYITNSKNINKRTGDIVWADAAAQVAAAGRSSMNQSGRRMRDAGSRFANQSALSLTASGTPGSLYMYVGQLDVRATFL